VRIVLDQDRCMGHGQCELVAPDLFKLDEHGIAQVLIECPDDSKLAALEQAIKRCPEAVISIED
jgi:ferredoxin